MSDQVSHFYPTLFDLSTIAVIDIILVSVIVFLFLNTLREGVGRRFLYFSFFIFLFFILSDAFELELVTRLLKGISALSLLAILILFKSDILNFFNNFRFRHLLSGTFIQIEKTPLETLFSAVSELSKRKIGALIIFERELNLDQFINHQKPLDAIISFEIIMSIFDDSSEGHDGAVIVRQNRLSYFGAHLPLSKTLQASNRGTRHAAALGITEVSDSIALVVSEEHGTVSVAQNGKLLQINNKETLFSFLSSEQNSLLGKKHRTHSKIPKRFLSNAVVSLLFSIWCWGFFVYGERSLIGELDRKVTLPGYKAFNVTVQLEGPRKSWMVEPLNPLKLLYLHETKIDDDNLIESDNLNWRVPRGLSIKKITPRRISLTPKRADT